MKKAVVYGLVAVLAVVVLAWLFRGCGGRRTLEREAAQILRGSSGMNESKGRIAQFAADTGVADLVALLDSEVVETRLVAIAGLGTRRNSKEATQALIRVATGENSEDAYWAIIALGDQGAPKGRRAIQDAMKSADPHRRAAACLAIYDYGDESLYPLVDQALDDEDGEVQGAAKQAKLYIKEGRVVPRGRPGPPPGSD